VPEVISDTSPLQYLYQADCLNLLPALYGSIVVPEGVAEEIAAGRSLGHSLPDLAALNWLRIAPVPHRRILVLATDLGKGEQALAFTWVVRSGTPLAPLQYLTRPDVGGRVSLLVTSGQTSTGPATDFRWTPSRVRRASGQVPPK
jgi:hypothetical protein